MATTNRKRPFGKVTFTFVAIIIGLILITITVGLTTSNQLNQVNTLQNQLNTFQASNNQLQTNYNNLQAQYNQLNSQYQQLKSSPNNSFNSDAQLSELQSQINNLESQLANATALIAKLQGSAGISLTYSDLDYVGPVGSGGAYWLQLSLKNTGAISITHVYVTINSVQVNMPFTYLDSTVSSSNPLPAYQTATGKLNVTPPVNNAGTYPLVIQATAVDGTVYTYETTITSH